MGKAKPLIDRFERMCIPEPNSGCWLWLGHIPKSGYGQFRMTTDPRERCEGAHRASWILHNGSIPNGLDVLHRCDVRCCVNPHHLFLGTKLDNMQDAASKGRMNWKPSDKPRIHRGEKHNQARLTVADILVIRGSAWKGVDLAKRYSVTPTQISRIRLGKSWKHLEVAA